MLTSTLHDPTEVHFGDMCILNIHIIIIMYMTTLSLLQVQYLSTVLYLSLSRLHIAIWY